MVVSFSDDRFFEEDVFKADAPPFPTDAALVDGETALEGETALVEGETALLPAPPPLCDTPFSFDPPLGLLIPCFFASAKNSGSLSEWRSTQTV